MLDNQNPACECWLLDVGQGSSTVILLGDRKGIVIDCGPKGSIQTLSFLKRYVDTLVAMIISHNDADHDGNIARILTDYSNSINQIYFLDDGRPASEIQIIKAIAVCESEEYAAKLPRPKRLERNGDFPGVIYDDNGVRLEAIFPDLMHNKLLKDSRGGANKTSGILRLQCWGRKIILSGDASIEGWEAVASEETALPIPCDVMSVPHHGGQIAVKSEQEKSVQKHLYNDLIMPKYAVVSVGTSNRYGHPLPSCLCALAEAGVTVVCTQMTERCTRDLEVARELKGSRLSPFSKSSYIPIKNRRGESLHVACFGSVAVEIRPNGVKILGLESHQLTLDRLAEKGVLTPLCRSNRH